MYTFYIFIYGFKIIKMWNNIPNKTKSNQHFDIFKSPIDFCHPPQHKLEKHSNENNIKQHKQLKNAKTKPT